MAKAQADPDPEPRNAPGPHDPRHPHRPGESAAADADDLDGMEGAADDEAADDGATLPAEPGVPAQELPVGPRDAGARLDAFLASRLKLSRQQVREVLARSAVRLDGRVVPERRGGLKLAAGARVEVEPFDTRATARVVPRPDLPLTILAQGPGWVVVDKPAGLPVHPLEPGETGTVLNAVAARWPGIQGVGEGGLRSGVVHRLDLETSGCLAFALDATTWKTLRNAFRQHRTRKLYRAIVLGRIADEGQLSLDLVVAQHRPARVRVVPRDDRAGERDRRSAPAPRPRRCDLAWRSAEAFPAQGPWPGATLIEVELGTGFLHQIRVMLAHLGHGVLGDAHYGPAPGSEDALALAAAPVVPVRPMLHAAELSAGPAVARCPDPLDLASCLARLRGGPALP